MPTLSPDTYVYVKNSGIVIMLPLIVVFSLLISISFIGSHRLSSQEKEGSEEFLYLNNAKSTITDKDRTDVKNLSSQILMSKAWAAFDLFRWGDAHFYASLAWNKNNKNLPEADYLIGLIHYTNLSYLLAKKSFNRALVHEKNTNTRIGYLYALASVYLAEGNIDDYSRTLQNILIEGLAPANIQKIENQRNRARHILFEHDLNRVILMYRWPSRKDLDAAEYLAMINYHTFIKDFQQYIKNFDTTSSVQNIDAHISAYWDNLDTLNIARDKRIQKALELLLYSLTSHIWAVVDQLMFYLPDYEFQSLEHLFQTIKEYHSVRNYSKTSGLYRTFYLLSVVMHIYNSQDTQYKYLFNILRQIPEAGEWAQRAQAQFEKPYIETYLLENVNKQFKKNEMASKTRNPNFIIDLPNVSKISEEKQQEL